MRKTALLAITILIILVMSACSSYTYYVPERDEDSTTDQISVKALFDEYGGTWAYSWDEDTFEDLWFYYYNDNINVCIDSTMHQSYINASILAVEEFDSLEYISISWEMSDDPATLNIIEPCSYIYDSDLDMDIYDNYIIFTIYSGSEEPFCSDIPGGDDDTLGCNSSWYDDNDGGINNSTIKFNVDLMDNASDELKEHVALHELGHSFGLDDLYDDILEEYSIMYYAAGNIILTDLTEFDRMNLEWMYKNKE
jgi:hypothetical protein